MSLWTGRWWLISGCLLAVVSRGSAGEPTKDLATVEKAIAESWESVDSIKAEFTFMQDVSTAEYTTKSEGKGNLLFTRRGGKTRYRMETSTRTMQLVNGQRIRSDSEVTVVDDSEQVLTYNRINENRRYAMRSKSDPSKIGSGGRTALDQMRSAYSLTVQPDEEVNGRDCFVVRGTPSDATSAGVANVSYFDKATGMLIKSVSMEGEKVIQEMVYTKVESGVEVPDDAFTIDIPEDVEIMDMTNRSGPPGS